MDKKKSELYTHTVNFKSINSYLHCCQGNIYDNKHNLKYLLKNVPVAYILHYFPAVSMQYQNAIQNHSQIVHSGIHNGQIRSSLLSNYDPSRLPSEQKKSYKS